MIEKIEISSLKDRLAYFTFFLGIICEFIVSFSGFLIGGYKEPLIIVLGMFCFGLSIITSYDYVRLFNSKEKSDVKNCLLELCIYVAFFAFALCCYYFQKSALVLRIVLILIAARELSKNVSTNYLKKVVAIFFYGSAIFMFVCAILSLFGIHNTFSITQNYRNVPETRYCFGFYHPNGFAFFYLKTIVLGLYLFHEKIKKSVILVSAPILVVPIILSKSKIALVTYILAYFFIVLYKFIGKIVVEKIIYVFGIVEYVIVIALVAISPWSMRIISKGGFFGKFLGFFNDKLLTGRMHSMRETLNTYSIKLFGYGNSITTTENGYVNSLYSEGLIFLLLFMAMTLWLLHKMYKNHDVCGMIIVIAMIAYLFSESFMAYFNKNLIWLMLIGYVSSKNIESTKGESS